MNIKKIIAKEGLIIIAIGVLLYFSVLLFCQNVPIVLPKYRAQFANGSSYIVTIYPDIAYSSVLNPKAFLKAVHNPAPKLVSKRIEEFAQRANVHSLLKESSCINSWQLRLSEAYSFILSQGLAVKILFVYFLLLLARFVYWAAKTLGK